MKMTDLFKQIEASILKSDYDEEKEIRCDLSRPITFINKNATKIHSIERRKNDILLHATIPLFLKMVNLLFIVLTFKKITKHESAIKHDCNNNNHHYKYVEAQAQAQRKREMFVDSSSNDRIIKRSILNVNNVTNIDHKFSSTISNLMTLFFNINHNAYYKFIGNKIQRILHLVAMKRRRKSAPTTIIHTRNYSAILLLPIILTCIRILVTEATAHNMKYSANIVKTKYGELRGIIVRNNPTVEAYLGVPYATPPTGSLRFVILMCI